MWTEELGPLFLGSWEFKCFKRRCSFYSNGILPLYFNPNEKQSKLFILCLKKHRQIEEGSEMMFHGSFIGI